VSTCASFVSVIQYLYITFQKCYILRCAYAPPPHARTRARARGLFLNMLAILVGVMWSKTCCVQHVLIQDLYVITRPVTVAECVPV